MLCLFDRSRSYKISRFRQASRRKILVRKMLDPEMIKGEEVILETIKRENEKVVQKCSRKQ